MTRLRLTCNKINTKLTSDPHFHYLMLESLQKFMLQQFVPSLSYKNRYEERIGHSQGSLTTCNTNNSGAGSASSPTKLRESGLSKSCLTSGGFLGERQSDFAIDSLMPQRFDSYQDLVENIKGDIFGS